MIQTFEVNMENLSEDECSILTRLIKKANRKMRWCPKWNQNYWAIGGDLTVNSYTWREDNADQRNFECRNCFKTAADALFEIECIKTTIALANYADEHNKPINWQASDEPKYNLAYDVRNDEINISVDYELKWGVTYFSDENIAKDAIKEVGEARLKKYYFRIGKEE